MSKTKVDVSPVLYNAATESLVSDASATSTFEKMISVAHSHATAETFKLELKATEEQIKKEFEVTSMPGPWRSGKSVILGAMKLGISLVGDNGTYVGKTFLQNKIKEAKSEDKKTLTATDYINKICNLLNNIPPEFDKFIVWTAIKDYVNAD